MTNKVHFYFFSGTGNTLFIIKKMINIFEKNGITVKLFRMEDTQQLEIDKGITIGLGFPVAMQGTYRLVWDFVESLPKAKGNEIFMVDTLALFSGGIVGPMKRIVARKGYIPIGAKEIIMPSNFFVREKHSKRIDKAVAKAEKFAMDLIKGKAKWIRIPVISDMVSWISRQKSHWDVFLKPIKFSLNKEKCIKCGLCSKLCPVNNIKMDEYPVYGEKCTLCLRCVSFCPTDAIFFKGIKSKYQPLISANEILKIKGDD